MPAQPPIASIRIFVAGAFGALICLASGSAEDKIDFAKDIKSVLSSKCYRCHGAKKQEAGLRLDAKQAALDGGNSGAVIVPGRSDESELFLRISTDDADKLMPPEGERLTDKQVELIRQWIEQGAAWPDEDGGKQENAR